MSDDVEAGADEADGEEHETTESTESTGSDEPLDGELDADHVFVGDLEDLDQDDDGAGELGIGSGVNRAPICGFCGVTALPADPSNVIDTTFVCDNEDCDAYRDRV